MATHRKLILIVEDSAIQAQEVRLLLEQEGLQVLWAPNGRAGVEMAWQEKPDVIVLDLEMPEMNGLEACRLLKQDSRSSQIPIIVLTAHTETFMVMRGLSFGALDFIPKDVFSGKVLIETLKAMELLGQKEPGNEEKNG